jgi:hypothetical protein
MIESPPLIFYSAGPGNFQGEDLDIPRTWRKFSAK